MGLALGRHLDHRVGLAHIVPGGAGGILQRALPLIGEIEIATRIKGQVVKPLEALAMSLATHNRHLGGLRVE